MDPSVESLGYLLNSGVPVRIQGTRKLPLVGGECPDHSVVVQFDLN